MAPTSSFLFVSYCRPYATVSAKTLSRWILNVMEDAGLDISAWKPHSTRSAASRHQRKQLSCAELLKLANWSASGAVHKKFYERYI